MSLSVNDYGTLNRWNQTAKPYPLGRCLHEWIEDQAHHCPDVVALRYSGQVLTYAELNRRANQCAHYLRGLGVGPGQIVAVLMDRSPELPIVLLAILKSGAAYLPLDSHYPHERLRLLLNDADVSVVLTQQAYQSRLDDFDGTCLSLDSEWAYLDGQATDNPPPRAVADDVAYVIYTSGSTGKPKGCMISHRAICNRLLWMQEHYQITAADNIMQKTPYTFDVSVWELFLPLLAGACLVFAKPEGHKDNAYLVRLIMEERVTVCHFVPSMLRFFLNQPEVGLCTTLTRVFTSGEALPYDVVDVFLKTLPAQLHNLYGPTEAAVDVSYWRCERRGDQKIPIGKPIANIQLYILDPELRQVPIGEIGELHIGGVGLAKGYLHRPELTQEKFINHPFAEESGAKLYKTGDRARYLPDGNIEFLGRLDFQVKVRGFRIELGEIETALRSHAAVADAVVLVRDADSGDPKLVAYIVAQEAVTAKQLHDYSKNQLPDYMLPNRVVFLAQLPVTAHGKADREALPWPVDDDGTGAIAPVAVSPLQRQTQTLETLLAMAKAIVAVSVLQPDDDLFDSGATSFTLVRLAETIHQHFNVTVPIAVFLEHATVTALAAYIDAVLVNPAADTGGAVNATPKPCVAAVGRIALPAVDFNWAAYRQVQIRRLSPTTISSEVFGQFLALLKQGGNPGQAKYLYASAGGLNPIQTYIYVKPQAVAGLAAGVYYHHPIAHQLYLLTPAAAIDPSVFLETDRPLFAQAGFAVFFIAQLTAIAPIYKSLSPALTVLEAGYMGQLLLSRQSGFNLALAPVLGVAFAQIQALFRLDDSHQFIHCLLGGTRAADESAADYGYGTGLNISGHLDELAGFVAPTAAETDFPSQAERDLLHGQHAQLRAIAQDGQAVPLAAYQSSELYYQTRSARRQYLKLSVPITAFSQLLTLFRGK
ncbi:MAG: amino acid adenylation domain-containing protein, partial [Methylovulum sp.]|nr:amino acid adenylation domain-containing protein [Methylovulum sp.]